MKFTAIFLSFSILLFKNVILYSQERISKPIPVIGTQIKGQLVKSTGWLLNPEGQWISRPNRIPSYLDNNFKTLLDYEYEGLGIDNFISYQIRDIKIKDSTYSILIKRYKDGYYKYSAIKEGWYNYNSVVFYVFSKNEWVKLDRIVNDSINLIKVNYLYSNSIDWINNETYISDIQKEIVKEIDKKGDNEEGAKFIIFHVAPYKKKNIVQFQIYSSYSKYNIIGGIIKEHEVQDENGKYSFDKKKLYLTNDLFKYCYYEIDFTTFNNFITIKK